jgi:hypothetical protein
MFALLEWYISLIYKFCGPLSHRNCHFKGKSFMLHINLYFKRTCKLEKTIKKYLKKIIHSLLMPPSKHYRTSSYKQVVPVSYYNMKQVRPWMLANLKIIWQFHAHPVHQKVSRFFGPRYIGDDFFLGPNLVSFNGTVVLYEISKVNFRVETKILVSMSEEI